MVLNVQSITALFFYNDAPSELITIDLKTGQDENGDTVSAVTPCDLDQMIQDYRTACANS
jgi:hypothetical protein